KISKKISQIIAAKVDYNNKTYRMTGQAGNLVVLTPIGGGKEVFVKGKRILKIHPLKEFEKNLPATVPEKKKPKLELKP
ncbi:unnamed protein product, partial [marine sediment metagenome]